MSGAVVRLCDGAFCTANAVRQVRVVDPGSGSLLARCHCCETHLAAIRAEAAKPARTPVKVFELAVGTDE